MPDEINKMFVICEERKGIHKLMCHINAALLLRQGCTVVSKQLLRLSYERGLFHPHTPFIFGGTPDWEMYSQKERKL